jgi:hypothetical protein
MSIQRITFEGGKAELVIADKMPVEEATYLLQLRVPLTLDERRPLAEVLLTALHRVQAELEVEMTALRSVADPGHTRTP